MSAIVEKALLKAREAFGRNVTRNVEFRINQLQQLQKCLTIHQEEFVEALKADFRKPRFESIISEIDFVKNDIQYQLDHIHDYVKPQYTKKAFANFFDNLYIKYDPYGVVLIFSAWNYPVNLLLSPLVGAITAGNCAIIKPSEVASNVEKLVAKLLPQYLNQDCYHVITGGPEVAQQVLNEKYDFIFFTGSTSIGKQVYGQAVKNLTPVVLELGGKSPVYIDESVVDSNLELVAKRLIWGKLVNAGQTCIAPDYVLCTRAVQDKLVQVSKKVLKDFYNDPKQTEDFARIINDRHFERLSKLLKATQGNVVIGGDVDASSRYIAPTIVSNVSSTDSLMSEELFGPILPLVNVESADQAIDFINRGEKPLTMYLFSNKKDIVQRFINETSSGSVAVNECLIQFAAHSLPFGGVGQSGIGRYHGQFSMQTFSHHKSVLAKDYNPLVEFFASSRYPPYTTSKMNRLKLLLGKTPIDELNYGKIVGYLSFFTVGVVSVLATNLFW